MKPLIDAAAMVAGRSDPAKAVRRLAAVAVSSPAPPPPLVGLRMAEFTLLAGIPLRYLIPDPQLLPDDALRFFVLDPDWLADLLAGILSVGLGDDAPDAVGAAAAAAVAAAPLVRDLRRGRVVDAPAGQPGTARPGAGCCGLLLRSALVERWPGLVVRGYTGQVPDDVDPDRSPDAAPLPPLRFERLTPSILIVLWASTPDLVLIQEPPGAPRLGVDLAGGPRLRVRAADGAPTGAVVPVPVDGNGVVDVPALAGTLAGSGAIPDAADSAAFALQLLQPPARRRFRRGAP